MPSLIDLHSHSTISDGLLLPQALVEHAAAQGVKVLSLTDHDDTAGLEVAAKTAAERGMQLVNGVEISVTWRRRTIHVVGLRIDPDMRRCATGLKKSAQDVMYEHKELPPVLRNSVLQAAWKVPTRTLTRALSAGRISRVT